MAIMVNVPFIRLRPGTHFCAILGARAHPPSAKHPADPSKEQNEAMMDDDAMPSILRRWGLNPLLTLGREPSSRIPTGQVARRVLSLQEAVERTGTSKVDIWRPSTEARFRRRRPTTAASPSTQPTCSPSSRPNRPINIPWQRMPCPLWRLQNLPERAQRLKRMPRPTSRSRSGPLLRSPRAFPSGYPRHQRVTNCVRTGMTGGLWT